jgi:hypothetical protein
LNITKESKIVRNYEKIKIEEGARIKKNFIEKTKKQDKINL